MRHSDPHKLGDRPNSCPDCASKQGYDMGYDDGFSDGAADLLEKQQQEREENPSIMAHFDTGRPHGCSLRDCGWTYCSCGKIWNAMHQQEIRDEEPAMKTYLITWEPTRGRHMFQTIEAENAEEAVRKFENVYGVTADAIAYPVQKNAWGYLRHVEPPSDNRIHSNRIVF